MDSPRILIAKTTQLGDVVISLPMAARLKQHFSGCTVFFLTQGRTQDVAARCLDIDAAYEMPQTFEELVGLLAGLRLDVFIQANTSQHLAEAAKAAQIPMRIGSAFRWYNWPLCSHRVLISRGYRHLNKRLLDLQYLRPLGVTVPAIDGLAALYRFSQQDASAIVAKLGLNLTKRRIILHPTLITARIHQWPLEAFQALMNSFDPNIYQWVITGTQADREYLGELLAHHGEVDLVDSVGQLSLDELVTLMQNCHGIVVGNTGPLHLAAALGINTLGFYQANVAVQKRWAAVGRSVTLLQSNTVCQGDKSGSRCPCVKNITVTQVADVIAAWFEK